jgi:regulator of protease activity HflC (stomatin/prohibitin superfamily)
MLFIILGIIVLGISYFVIRINYKLDKYYKLANVFGVAFILIGISNAILMQVNAGQTGVQTLFGKVNNTILVSGLNFINPLADVVMFDTKTQNYTMSGVHDEGDKGGDDAIRVLSADGLEVIIDLTVLYRILPNEAPRILSDIGTDYKNTIVRPITRTKIRDNAVYYDAVALYSTKRDEFQSRIFKGIEKDFKDRGLVLEQLLVRNITLPQSVKIAIESKIRSRT